MVDKCMHEEDIHRSYLRTSRRSCVCDVRKNYVCVNVCAKMQTVAYTHISGCATHRAILSVYWGHESAEERKVGAISTLDR
eukprot:21465_6